MKNKKPSFFERLTGSLLTEEYDDETQELEEGTTDISDDDEPQRYLAHAPQEDASLAVDMYQTPETIVIRANVAGIPLEDIDVRITHETITIRASHHEEAVQDHGNYYHKELTWGSFSRSLTLPEEVDESAAEAVQEDGILTVTLPKINKSKETRLEIKKR